MNERIQKLAEQAGATFTKGYIELSDGQLMLSDNADVNHTNIDLAKFAELIVKECIEQASTGNMHGNNQWDKALTFAADNIKKHFGVKE